MGQLEVAREKVAELMRVRGGRGEAREKVAELMRVWGGREGGGQLGEME